MHRPLDGFRALVTGASSGIGRAMAQNFAAAGAAVLVNYRSNAGPAEDLVRDIERQGAPIPRAALIARVVLTPAEQVTLG